MISNIAVQVLFVESHCIPKRFICQYDPASVYNFYLFFYYAQQGIAQDLVYLLLINVNLGAMMLQKNIKAMYNTRGSGSAR